MSFSFPLSFPTHLAFVSPANSITYTFTQRVVVGKQKARVTLPKNQVRDLLWDEVQCFSVPFSPKLDPLAP